MFSKVSTPIEIPTSKDNSLRNESFTALVRCDQERGSILIYDENVHLMVQEGIKNSNNLNILAGKIGGREIPISN